MTQMRKHVLLKIRYMSSQKVATSSSSLSLCNVIRNNGASQEIKTSKMEFVPSVCTLINRHVFYHLKCTKYYNALAMLLAKSNSLNIVFI